MTLQSATIRLLICFSLPLCSIAVGQEEAADYGDFLEQPSSGAPAKTHTWSTTPSGDGEITPTDKIEQNELLATQPQGTPEAPVTELASEVLTDKQDDSGDMLARLLSGGGGPPAPGVPAGGGRIKKALAGGLVALFGAMVGVGVALLRARYGKTPDPARNVRVIRGQSPTPPRTGGRRML